MCRLAAYLGSEITLSQFLLEPEHSLVKQSWAPNEMREGTINADGYGIAWLSDNRIPCTYKNVLPIWSDTNLEGLGHSLKSKLWLANVRSATPGQGVNETNTQPFIKGNLIFTHNGCLSPFDNTVKADFLHILSNDFRAEINGNSDSLYLFALLQEQLLSHQSLSDAIVATINELKIFCNNNIKALLNIVISDGEHLYASRHAINAKCPSLYYLLNDDNVSIASEPLTPENEWIAFPEHTLISFNNSSVISQTNL